MNKLSGLAIFGFMIAVWMSVWGASKNEYWVAWVTVIMVIAAGALLILSLPDK